MTKEKAAEEALRASEEKFFKIFQASPDCIAIVDFGSGGVLEVNERFEQVTGYARSEILGRTFADLGLLVDAALRDVMVAKLRETGSIRDFEYQMRRKTGEIATIWWSAEVIEIAGRRCFVSVHRDVTGQRELEAQLRQAQKMEAIGRLAGGIAHDFNNLLTAILGYAELVTRRLDPDSPAREDLEEIQRAATSAESLTRQLLIFSRKGVVQPAVLDLNELVGRLDRMLRRVVGDDIDFIVRRGRDVGHINADGGQIEQVIMNLVVNARDAMPSGGTLTLETAAVQIDDAFVRAHPGATAGAHVKLTVEDTGAGMTPDVQAQIFTPFFTTKGPTKGTGLGLATVHGIVQQAGGYISVESAPGSGTTFAIYLPRVAARADAAGVSADAEAVHGAAATILLVDDDDSIRAMGTRALREYGHTVLPARHAAEALKVAERHDGTIDLLFTDIVMPGLNGRALAQRLQLSRGDLKVLYTTGHTDDSEALREVQAAGADFLPKPYTPESLARRVRGVLDRV